ncbi:alkaline phosphatase family protein [Schumannella sp. 10F1B-5-1]|uniref:alkaline phosphatase family protein n=1 Tax=Schumannella sp. 10F1B-5-1 TaxID=2590780 RepID=UPI00113155BA|nr:alkaline phosphatase family protein [Schumannella sp. 10F1B-5-1]TPW70875.1 alkaline phosphatase family protein [Schumannella sp. 10F1B-5-1]
MLPARQDTRFRLAEVLPDSLATVLGESSQLGLPPARRIVVALVDGLGAAALRERIGHARRLASAFTRGSTISVGFPSTTAAMITTLTTGADPGEHGLVGYAALDAANDRVLNLLNGWDAQSDPLAWQSVPTVFERAVAAGIPAVVIAPPRYRDSRFTQAALRGAEYLPAATIEERAARAVAELRRHERLIAYLYIPELDVVAHRHGVESGEWTAALEQADAALGELARALGPDDLLLVTADHGVVDIPAESHVVPDAALFAEVRHLAGEPRCLQLHLEPPADAAATAATWQRVLGRSAWVATRDEAVAGGLFGEPGRVDARILPRIGDVLVGARARVAFYRDSDSPARGMVGQHGSATPEEMLVPLLRFRGA